MLMSSDTARRRGQVLAILGEGRLECGDVPGAQREFEKISQDYDKTPDPLAIAQAQRGLGRVALMQGAADKALGLLKHAREEFKRLNRVQEEARTALYQAIALWQLGERKRACTELEQAQARFVAMKMRADRDAKRAERLLRELGAASRSQ